MKLAWLPSHQDPSPPENAGHGTLRMGRGTRRSLRPSGWGAGSCGQEETPPSPLRLSVLTRWCPDIPDQLVQSILNLLAPPGGYESYSPAAQALTPGPPDFAPGRGLPGTPAPSRAQEPQRRLPEGWDPLLAGSAQWVPGQAKDPLTLTRAPLLRRACEEVLWGMGTPGSDGCVSEIW